MMEEAKIQAFISLCQQLCSVPGGLLTFEKDILLLGKVAQISS